MKKVLDIDIDAWCIPISIIFGAIVSLLIPISFPFNFILSFLSFLQVGLCVPGNSDLSPGYRRVSSVIGWI